MVSFEDDWDVLYNYDSAAEGNAVVYTLWSEATMLSRVSTVVVVKTISQELSGDDFI